MGPVPGIYDVGKKGVENVEILKTAPFQTVQKDIDL